MKLKDCTDCLDREERAQNGGVDRTDRGGAQFATRRPQPLARGRGVAAAHRGRYANDASLEGTVFD